MAVNLRLPESLEVALREEAASSGRSQQRIIRDALELHLRSPESRPPALVRRSIPEPRVPFRPSSERFVLPSGVTSLELLQREDRI